MKKLNVYILFFGGMVKKYISDQKNVTCINCWKTKKDKSVIFSISPSHTHVSIHTENWYPSLIRFLLTYSQNNMFQTKNVTCVDCRKVKKARPMIFCILSCPL